MKSHLLLSAILTVSLTINAQTKLMAHKSMGGSNATFATALEQDQRLKGSSYGHAPEPLISNALLDSVIFVDANTSIMVTSLYEETSPRRGIYVDPCMKFDHNGNLLPWKPGRDTIVGHEIFSSGASIFEMQKALDEDYYFRNNGSDVIFWNFPEGEVKTEKKNSVPLIHHWIDSNKLLVCLILSACLILGSVIWRNKVEWALA